jgi:antitoxin ParD1/3/4
MATEIPSDLLPFVRRMVAAKRFLSDGDVIAAGIRLLQARETLRDEVTRGFDQLDAGLGIPETQVSDRVERRVRAIESGEL